MSLKKKFLLINPPPNANAGALLNLETLGLGYVANAVRTTLKQTHEVYIWDCAIVDPSMDHLQKLLSVLDPDYVGLSLSAMNSANGVAISHRIKKWKPAIKIIIGGILASSLEDAELSVFRPDAIVRGEGEILVNDVLRTFATSPGLGNLVVRQEMALDVDALGWPCRDMLPWQLKQHPQASISASRGCPYRCSFCSIPQSGKIRKWRPRDIEDVVEEMHFLNTQYGVSHFYFVDDNFLINTRSSIERAAHFADLVLEKLPPVRFGFMCRSALVEKSLFSLLKKAGLSGVFLGIESFSQAVLDRYNKKEKVEEHLQAINILNNLCITINPGFIFFDPWTNISEMSDTLKVMANIDYPVLQSINSKLTCYKGTLIEKQIAPLRLEGSRLGITEYKFRTDKVDDVFKVCCDIYKNYLTNSSDYENYQTIQYCLGYLQPYFLNSDWEPLFTKYYNQCKALWRLGDLLILQWIYDYSNQTKKCESEIRDIIDKQAASYWRQGTALAEQFVAISELYFIKRIVEGTEEQARLAALVFTLPYKNFNFDKLFSLCIEKGKNIAIVAELMPYYRGINAQRYYFNLLKNKNNDVVSSALRSAALSYDSSVLDSSLADLSTPGKETNHALQQKIQQLKKLADLSYPEYILSFGLSDCAFDFRMERRTGTTIPDTPATSR
jgi:radical SAM superfamily enzyme YgiQ (UPF0313 family)